ncbi:MAG: ABC transporter permease [Acidimicrobiia bacterium]
MKISRRNRNRLITAAFGIMFIAGWEIASRAGVFHELVVPPPSRIVAELPGTVGTRLFLENVATTLVEILVGFSIASAFAFLLAILLSTSEIARVAIYPYIVGLQAPPKITLVPIFVTLFGFGLASKIAMAAVIAFFPMFLNMYIGLTQANREANKLFRALTASNAQTFLKLKLPGSLPFMFTGIKLGWTMSVIGVIVAEFLGARKGIGYLIQTYNFQLKMAQVFGLIIILSLFTVAIYKALERIEARWLFWSTDETSEAEVEPPPVTSEAYM